MARIFVLTMAATDQNPANLLPLLPMTVGATVGAGRRHAAIVASGRSVGGLERKMASEVRLETDALVATARRAASLMLSEQDLSDGETLARACALCALLICEMLLGRAGGGLDVTADVIAMLLSAYAEATTTSDFVARLDPSFSAAPASA